VGEGDDRTSMKRMYSKTTGESRFGHTLPVCAKNGQLHAPADTPFDSESKKGVVNAPHVL